MGKNLEARMNRAIKRIGGPLVILTLPDHIRKVIVECPDYETRVKMLELIADDLHGKK